MLSTAVRHVVAYCRSIMISTLGGIRRSCCSRACIEKYNFFTIFSIPSSSDVDSNFHKSRIHAVHHRSSIQSHHSRPFGVMGIMHNERVINSVGIFDGEQ